MSRRIQYTEEFKRDAVSQVKDRGYSVREVAERLGMCTKSLYAWVRQYHKPEKDIQEDKEQAAEIRRLRLELVGRVAQIRKLENLPLSPVFKRFFELWAYQVWSFGLTGQKSILFLLLGFSMCVILVGG